MIFSALLITSTAIGLLRPDTVARDRVHREIGALVRVDTVPGPPGEGTVRVVGFNIDTRQRMPLLAGFMRAHGPLVWYLATHTPGAEARMVTGRDSPLAVRDSVISALQTNQIFNDRVFAMLSEYWRTRGRVIEGMAPAVKRERVGLTRLSAVGARFFYPDRFSSRGDTMFTHICAGLNGIGDLPDPVDPLMEAFVFAAVNGSLREPESPLMRAFELASKRAKVTSASKDASTRVRRAQGALWSQLEQDPALRSALAKAYSAHRVVLPFQLAIGS